MDTSTEYHQRAKDSSRVARLRLKCKAMRVFED